MNLKKFGKQALILMILSAAIYILQLLIFRDSRNTFFYVLQDMAFLPLTIVVTTLIIGALLERQSKKERIESSRILSCSFFSMVGNDMMELLCRCLDDEKKIVWDEEVFGQVHELLEADKETMLIIASNPNLLEHADFTDLLWAVLHLLDELNCRMGMGLTDADRRHIAFDAQRVFDLYMQNWTEYNEYTKQEYPYYTQSKSYVRWQQNLEKIKK